MPVFKWTPKRQKIRDLLRSGVSRNQLVKQGYPDFTIGKVAKQMARVGERRGITKSLASVEERRATIRRMLLAGSNISDVMRKLTLSRHTIEMVQRAMKRDGLLKPPPVEPAPRADRRDVENSLGYVAGHPSTWGLISQQPYEARR